MAKVTVVVVLVPVVMVLGEVVVMAETEVEAATPSSISVTDNGCSNSYTIVMVYL
jgi:hypothetical protein